jgi:peptidyl-prolyl cis-trans isomerase C
LIYVQNKAFYRLSLTKGMIMAKAAARHILVSTEAECNKLKQQIADGADFAALAKKHSQCPSGQQGGALGTFSPGQMVREWFSAQKSARFKGRLKRSLAGIWSK